MKKFARWTRKKTKWGSITLGSRISYFDFEAYQAIIYDKTSLVLNMLREILGDDLFYEGMRKFYEKFRYNVAKTGDFFAVMQETTGEDLMPFFDCWFNSWRLPEVVVAHISEKTGDSYRLKVTVNQAQSPFVFPLWIKWEANGQSFSHRVIVKDKVQRFMIETGGKPKRVVFHFNDIVPGKIR